MKLVEYNETRLLLPFDGATRVSPFDNYTELFALLCFSLLCLNYDRMTRWKILKRIFNY